MSWVVYALVGPLVLTVVNFIDKLILEKEIRDPRCMPAYLALTSLVSAIVLWLVTGMPTLPLPDMLRTMLSGVLTTTAALFYFLALAREDTSNIIILINTQPVLVLTLAFIVLGERITAGQLAGFALVLLAALALTAHRKLGTIRPSATLGLMMLSNLFNAGAVVVFKQVSESYPFERIIAFETLGFAAGGLVVYLLIPSIRRAFHASLRTVSRRAVLMVGVNESIYVVAKICIYLAISLGPVALVSVLGSSQIFFGIMAGWLLTVLAPAIYREPISHADLLRKGALSLVLFGGVYLINLNA
jgi:drug/metabolite transporter (DMT)-like permease